MLDHTPHFQVKANRNALLFSTAIKKWNAAGFDGCKTIYLRKENAIIHDAANRFASDAWLANVRALRTAFALLARCLRGACIDARPRSFLLTR